MHYRTLIAFLIVSAALGAACGGGSSPSPTAETLEGRTFLSTGVEGQSLVAGSVVRITFQAGQLSVRAGCNSMGGPYRIDGDLLVPGQLSTTEMACDPLLMAQDQWVGDLLGGATIAIGHNPLTLTKGTVRLMLLNRVVADPDRPLVGTRWVVDGVISGGAVSNLPAGIVAAVTFGDGAVIVEAGCNQGGGSARITDAAIEFGPIGLTKKGCEPPAMSVELAVTQVLSGTIAYRIEAGTLTLSAGDVGLTLRAGS